METKLQDVLGQFKVLRVIIHYCLGASVCYLLAWGLYMLELDWLMLTFVLVPFVWSFVHLFSKGYDYLKKITNRLVFALFLVHSFAVVATGIYFLWDQGNMFFLLYMFFFVLGCIMALFVAILLCAVCTVFKVLPPFLGYWGL